MQSSCSASYILEDAVGKRRYFSCRMRRSCKLQQLTRQAGSLYVPTYDRILQEHVEPVSVSEVQSRTQQPEGGMGGKKG